VFGFNNEVPFENLHGKTLAEIRVGQDSDGADEIEFVTMDGERFLMYHVQDCCEGVSIEDIVGSAGEGSEALSALLGSELLFAEMATDEGEGESSTWTFYKLSTMHHHVTIRWYGESNGWYSETVNFRQIVEDNDGEG